MNVILFVAHIGKLNAEMHWSEKLLDADSDEWKNVENSEPVFNHNDWEPGYTELRYVKVSNNGSLVDGVTIETVTEGSYTTTRVIVDASTVFTTPNN